MLAVKLVDAHCHLDFEAFDSDRSLVIKRAHDAGIDNIIIPGVKAEHWPRIGKLCEKEGLHACYGIHPYYVDRHSKQDLISLDRQLAEHPCVALGECGLDYRNGQPERQLQHDFFDAQLALAQQHSKPVVIHAVRATEDVIQALKNYPQLNGMLHSYSGSLEQAQQLVDMGFYISLGGNITHERAQRLRRVAAGVPLDALLIETDAPDQPDALHSGERNEPVFIINVLNALAELRSESAETIAQQTTENARRLFSL